MSTTIPYKIYLIGGAIRDALLDLEINDFDYMVVGLTQDNILEVIPQVLTPTSNNQHPTYKLAVNYQEQPVELALARTETKVSKGYFGFKYNVEGVSLEQDILRRDLTINTLALAVNLTDVLTGKITKSYILEHQDQIIDVTSYGKQDIAERKFRAVSDKFIDDPIRVSRLAKFYVKFKEFGFKVDESLISLMQNFSLTEAQELFKPSLKILNQNLQYSLERNQLIDYLEIFKLFKLISLTDHDKQSIINFNQNYLKLTATTKLNTQNSQFTLDSINECKQLELDSLNQLFLAHLQELDTDKQLAKISSFSQLSKFKIIAGQTPSCFDFVIRHYDKTIIKQILAYLKSIKS